MCFLKGNQCSLCISGDGLSHLAAETISLAALCQVKVFQFSSIYNGIAIIKIHKYKCSENSVECVMVEKTFNPAYVAKAES